MTTGRILMLAVVIMAAIWGYSSSLSGDFQFDDDISISANPLVTNPERFKSLTWREIFGGVRPLTGLTYRANYASPWFGIEGYHAVNLLIHLLVVVMVYHFTGIIFRNAGHNHPESAALLVAALFGLHPVQSQAVSYLSQRSESLASLFYLLAFVLLIRAREQTTIIHRVIFFISGAVVFMAGIGAKDIVITLPAALVLYDMLFRGNRSFLKRLTLILPVISVAAVYMWVRVPALYSDTTVGFGVKQITPVEYLITQCRVVVTYLRLILLPFNQTLDYDYPVMRSLQDIVVWLSLSAVVALLVIAFFARNKHKVVTFGILWFFLLLVPTSSIIPISDVIFEHRVYLASWGLIAAGIWSLYLLFDSQTGRVLESSGTAQQYGPVIIAAAITILFSVALHERNKVWQSKISMWRDVASKAPAKARAHNNLGNCYFIGNDYQRAANEYRKAISLDSKWYEAYYNLAMSLEKTGHISEAVYYYLFFAREAPETYSGLKKEIMRKYGLSG